MGMLLIIYKLSAKLSYTIANCGVFTELRMTLYDQETKRSRYNIFNKLMSVFHESDLNY